MEENNNNIHSSIIDSAYNGYSLFKDDFRKLLKVYKGELDEALVTALEARGKSRIGNKAMKGLVNRMVAGFSNAYFSNTSLANVSPDSADTEQVAIKRQKAFDWYWTKSGMKPFLPLSKNFLDVTIYGTTIAKCYWDGAKPKIEHVNIHNVYFDPSAVSIYDARYLVHKIYLTKDDIRDYKKANIYTSRFKMGDISASSYNSDVAYQVETVNQMSRVELHEVYIKKGGVWYVSTMYDKSTYLRKDVPLNDGLPFFVGYCMPRTIDPDDQDIKIYGDSPVASVVELVDELTIKKNQELDAISELLNPSYFTEAGSGLQESKLKRGAGKVVQVNDMSMIQKITENVAPILAGTQDRIFNEIKAISGIDVLISADNSAMINRQTADGMNMISSEQNLRMDNYIRTFNETFVEPLASHIMKLILRYNRKEFLLKGLNRPTEDDFSISINAGLGATSKQMKLQGLNDAFQKFMALQDSDKANRTIKDSLPLLGIKNTTDYFPDDDDEEAKAKQEQQAKEMMAKQQQQEEYQMQMQMAELEKIKAETQKAIQELQLKAQASQIEAEKIQLEHESNMGKIENKNRELDIKEVELEFNMRQEPQGNTNA